MPQVRPVVAEQLLQAGVVHGPSVPDPRRRRGCGANVTFVTQLRISEAAELLGLSDDTLRRMVDAGRIDAQRDEAGRMVVDGADLAALAQSLAHPAPPGPVRDESARNRMRGIVTRVLADTVMAQVELQCGPFRVVSLMSREAVDALGLEVGVVAIASVKATNVIVGIPQ